MVKTVLVVGLGRFGRALCDKIMRLGHHVMAVDKVHARVAEIADSVDLAVQLDATDEEALEKMGARNADIAVVSIGENLEASILATSIIKSFGIPQVISRAQTNLHARILVKVGADKIVFPEKDMGEKLGEQLIRPWLSRFSSLPGSPLIAGAAEPLQEMLGKTLLELDFRNTYNAIILYVQRGGKTLFPRGDTTIEKDDLLILAGEEGKIELWLQNPDEIRGQ